MQLLCGMLCLTENLFIYSTDYRKHNGDASPENCQNTGYHTQSDNLMLTLCNNTGYHVHSVTTQHYKCCNTVDGGYSKSLQFKYMTKSKQYIKGVYL